MYIFKQVAMSALILMFAFTGTAQETQSEDNQNQTEEQSEEQSSPKKFEKVQVTGSRIRRTDFEGPTPVMVIDRKSLDDSSYNSVGDVLRDMPISNFGAQRETTGTTTNSSASVNLRGQGATNTLVMLNGTRLQRNGRSGAADMNLIPEIAIESTDILLDGASAIYGADAIGGVVHLKTRKDFTGAEASIKYVVPDGFVGTRLDIGVIGGKQYEDWSVTAAYQFRQNDELRGSDRSWLRPEVGSPTAPTPAYFSNNGTPGDGTDDRWAMRPADIAACNADPDSNYVLENTNDVCRYNWYNIATELPLITQHSAYANVIWTPDSRTTWDTSLLFTTSTNDSQFAPVPGLLEVAPGAVAGWGVTLPNASTDGGVNRFRHRFLAAGNREFEQDAMAYNITSNYIREFGETWQANALVGFGQSENNSRTASGGMLRSEFLTIANSGNYNPYNPDPAALAPAFYVPFQDTIAYDAFIELGANGELFELGNGLPVSAAFGLQYSHSYYSDSADERSNAGDVIGGASSGGSGDRDFVAAYAELLVPITKKIEMQAAARFDWFSDFGLAASPMVAFKYAPSKAVALRASAGRAFKAPLLQDVYASGSEGFPFFIDQVKCEENRDVNNTYCRPQQYNVVQTVGNELEPEEAINLNFGVVYAPTSNFSMTADLWRIDMSNRIGVSNEQITIAQVRDPSGATLAANDIEVDRLPNGEIDQIRAPLQNLSGRVTDGLNLSLSYRLDTSIGSFIFADTHSHIFKLDSEPFSGVGFISFLEDQPQWRNSASLTYSPNRNHAFTLTYSMIPEYNTTDRFDKIPFYGELDVSYLTSLPWKATINVGVKNVLSATPPVDDFVGFNSALYNPLGLYGFANYRQTF